MSASWQMVKLMRLKEEEEEEEEEARQVEKP